jgi:DNA-binding MarR family transcriptional regulator
MKSKSIDRKQTRTEGDGERVFEAMHDLMHLYRMRQYQMPATKELTHLEGKALRFFANHPASTLSDVCIHFKRDKGQMAKLIQSLRSKSLLETKVHPDDRRQIQLTLSNDGYRIQKALRETTKNLAQAVLQGVKASELDKLLSTVEVLKENLNKVMSSNIVFDENEAIGEPHEISK